MPPHIDSYRFGRIKIDGTDYDADVIILPRGVVANWRRAEGHCLRPADLTAVVAAEVEVLVVGTGGYGAMTVPPATAAFLEENGVKVEALETAQAVRRYNELAAAGGHAVAAAVHLTC